MRDITEELRPYVARIQRDCQSGSGERQKHAAAIINLHTMHCRAPQDPGAYGLCCAAFDEWLKLQEPAQ